MGSFVGCLERVIEFWVPEIRRISWTRFSGAVPWGVCLGGCHFLNIWASNNTGKLHLVTSVAMP
jgi:hypothetical protein